MKWKLGMGLVLFAASQTALAGGQYVGMIKPLHYGLGSLYLDASATQMANRPACATRTYIRLAEDHSSPAFKEKFAMILAAWMADRPMALSGTGNCTSEGDEIISVVGYP